jgi:hypothetical protein
MLPIILGLIGGGFLVSAFSEDKKYAKGGSIPNNYKGKTAEEVWDEWTVDQRDHFLKDHNLYNTKSDPTMTSKEHKEYDGKAVEWGSDLKNKLEIHIEEGQYAKGGSVSKKQGYDDKKDEKLSMEHGKIAKKDFVGTHKQKEHSRRDDAQFEERMAKTKKETMTKKATVAKKNPQTNKFKQVMAHAKSTRKQGEAWTAAVSRAWKEMGK